eukprot:TRINITY_DN5019_c0_g1_i1.p1 TRINITY_DN5019_c0_g1~~TRINITY_DN5019_c0_g1_i1.p1  ORF type:complete len:224 (-),score=57.22 TRINITY_DN5019_c0_g1_i1:419-1090(-)
MVEQSLLDVVLNSRGHSTTVLNRVIYVAHVEKSSSDLSALEAFHKPLLNESFDDVSRCTGLLMHMGNDTVLHMLEGPSQSVEAFIQKLHNHTGPLSDIRVILSTEDIPNPAMPSWIVKSINLPRADSDLDAKEPLAPHLYRTYKGLVEVGAILTELQGEERDRAIEDMKGKYHEKLPGNELIASMLKSDQTCTLSEFLGIFTEEVQILEESEQIWPMLPGLQY